MGVHVELEAAVGVHVLPDQGREGGEVALGQAAGPVGPGEDLLEPEGVDEHHAVLEQMEAEHAQPLILGPVAGELALPGEEDEVVGAVPVLDDVEPVVDLAARRLVVQVAAKEHGLAAFPSRAERLVGRVLNTGRPRVKRREGRFGLGGAQPERGGVLHHLVALPLDQGPVDRPCQRVAEVWPASARPASGR